MGWNKPRIEKNGVFIATVKSFLASGGRKAHVFEIVLISYELYFPVESGQ